MENRRGGYYPYNSQADKLYFECEIKVTLNEQGANAWDKLIYALKNVCQPYNPNALFKEYEDPRSLIIVHIPKVTDTSGERSYNLYKVRSQRTYWYIDRLMQKIPLIVKNISINLAGKTIDISNKLDYLNENLSDGALVNRNATRPYSKKNGSKCGEYRYILNISKEDLKNVNNITIEKNDQLRFDNNSFHAY